MARLLDFSPVKRIAETFPDEHLVVLADALDIHVDEETASFVRHALDTVWRTEYANRLRDRAKSVETRND